MSNTYSNNYDDERMSEMARLVYFKYADDCSNEELNEVEQHLIVEDEFKNKSKVSPELLANEIPTQ